MKLKSSLCLLLFVILLLIQQASSLRVLSSPKDGKSNFAQLRTLYSTNSADGSTSSSYIMTGADSDSNLATSSTTTSWFNQYLYYIISGAIIIILLIAIRVIYVKKRKNKDQAELEVELKSNKITSVPTSTSIRL